MHKLQVVFAHHSPNNVLTPRFSFHIIHLNNVLTPRFIVGLKSSKSNLALAMKIKAIFYNKFLILAFESYFFVMFFLIFNVVSNFVEH